MRTFVSYLPGWYKCVWFGVKFVEWLRCTFSGDIARFGWFFDCAL